MKSEQLARLTGVSERQLQWWDEQNVVSPRIDGHARNYTIDQATVVGLVLELRRSGVNLDLARKVARKFEKFPTARWAIVVGNQVYFAIGPIEIAEAAAVAISSVVVVKIRHFVASDVPPAKTKRRREPASRGYRGVTTAPATQARAPGLLDEQERRMNAEALGTRTDGERPEYRTARDFKMALDRDRSLGG